MERYVEQNPELSNLPDVEDLESEHKRSGAEFKAATAALTKAQRALDAAKKKVASASKAQAKALDAAQSKPSARADQIKADADKKVDEASLAEDTAQNALDDARQTLDAAKVERDTWRGKYAFIEKERWYERLRNLRDSLTDDLDFVLIGQSTVQNPSVAQLLKKGYFNPDAPGKGGFDELFMTTMAHHGFDQGAEWEPGGVDSMHFELAEVVDRLWQPEDAKLKK